MKIGLSSESTLDFTQELLKEYDIHIVPFTIILGDKTAYDGDIKPQDIFDFVDATGILPTTSAVNDEQFRNHFSKMLEEYDEVIHISFSSTLSSACSNAYRVAQEFEHVHVIDSRALSTGTGCLLIYARQLANEGKSIEEIIAKVSARVPYIHVSLVTATIDYLKKGGRVGGLVALGAQLFKIKPEIYLDDGVLYPGKKFIGKQTSVVEQYCDAVFERATNPDLSIGFVTHANASPEMVEIAVNKMKERGFKRIEITKAGCTITSHAGPRALGLLFLNDGGAK